MEKFSTFDYRIYLKIPYFLGIHPEIFPNKGKSLDKSKLLKPYGLRCCKWGDLLGNLEDSL